MDSNTKTSQQNYGTNKPFNPFDSYNQERYQYRKKECISYTWSGRLLDNTARVFLIARVPLSVTKIMATWEVPDSSAYVQVEKLQNSMTPGSGFSILSIPFDCTQPGNVTYIREYDEFTLSIEDNSLDVGDRIAIWLPVEPDTLENLTVLVEYQYQN